MCMITKGFTDNTYNNVDVFFASFFFNTESDDDFEFNESISYWRSTRDVQSILSMYSYCSSLQLAQDTSDDGATILTSNGEEINQDCDNVWGGESLPICNTCETDILGDSNLDNFVDILDVVLIINYILVDPTILTDSQECLSDLDLNVEDTPVKEYYHDENHEIFDKENRITDYLQKNKLTQDFNMSLEYTGEVIDIEKKTKKKEADM